MLKQLPNLGISTFGVIISHALQDDDANDPFLQNRASGNGERSSNDFAYIYREVCGVMVTCCILSPSFEFRIDFRILNKNCIPV